MRERSDWIIRIALIGIACTTVAINIIISATFSPSFCTICHSSQASALQKSSHRDIRCNTCHQRNNVFAVFTWRARVVGMVARQITFSYRRPIVANVSQDNCKQCHDDILTRAVISKAIKMSHKEVADYLRCTECHNTVAHPGAIANPKPAAMDKCSVCHNGKQASVSCTECHIEGVDGREQIKTSWKITHGPQWRKLHGMGNLNTCTTCHGDIFCLRCHNASLPHPEFWVRYHPEQAKADAEGCYKCHHKSYCLSCHGIDMPHDDKFFKNHSSIAKKKGKKTCYRCHLEQGCLRCHASHIHPGLPKDRLQELRRSAGLDK
ncbi:MAG: hypothetical protein QME63_04390 [Actinomycetota bacterium]|nr:hypothetical protein [Actinomycetota bacterium]